MEDRLRIVTESCDQLVTEASRILSAISGSGPVPENDFGLVNNVEEIETTVHAQRMVQAAEALANVIHDLRISWALYDNNRHLKQVSRSIESAQEQSEIAKYKIRKLRLEVEQALSELSSHYAASQSPSISSFMLPVSGSDVK